MLDAAQTVSRKSYRSIRKRRSVVGGRESPCPGSLSATTRLTLVLAATFATFSLVVAGCANESRDSAASDESAQVVVGRVPAAIGGMPSVIMLEPHSPDRLPLPTEPVVMDQYGLTFLPGLLLVRPGQPVEFRNSEDVAHNVQVVDTATDSILFNVATVIGDPYEYTFERTGGYAVSCDIHPGMAAFVLVVSTPYAVVVEENGEFAVSDVPPGSYTVKVWNIDPARRIERAVEIADGRTDLALDAIR